LEKVKKDMTKKNVKVFILNGVRVNTLMRCSIIVSALFFWGGEARGSCNAAQAASLPAPITITYTCPGTDYLSAKLNAAAKKAQIIQELSFTTTGSLSAEKGKKCCDDVDVDGSADYIKYEGSLDASLKCTVVVPAWSGLYDAELTSPITFYACFTYRLGPAVTLTPTVTLAGSGEIGECLTRKEVSLSGSVGLDVSVGAEALALVRIFEEGHWYTVDTELALYIKGGGKTSVGATGSYAVEGDDEPVISGTVSLGKLTVYWTAGFTIAGHDVSVGSSKDICEGVSYSL